jgi:hypothetical protein
MTVDVESQISAYATWLEDQTGVSMRKPNTSAPSCRAGEESAVVGLDSFNLRPPRRSWTAVLAVAAALVLVGVGAAILRARGGSPAVGDGGSSSGARQAMITWYEVDAAGASTVETQPLVCRTPGKHGDCDALVGSRTVRYSDSDGEFAVSTEFGPAESNSWQALVLTGEEVDLGGRVGLVAPGNELAGFVTSTDTRVLVMGGGTNIDSVQIASNLVTRSESVTVPVVFGEAIPTEAEFPRDGVAARYYAGYLDTTGARTCVGGIGVPWNNPESCVPVEPDTLTVTVATPSPAGTILIATLPLHTVTAVVTTDDEASHPLTITDASAAGYKLVFADLDGSIPHELVAYDNDGAVIANTEITSTGGAPPGYLPADGTD